MPSVLPRLRSRRPVLATALVLAVLTVLLAAVLTATLVSRAVAAGADGVSYVPPVDAPVTDPFDLPFGPFGPGNRGLGYVTVPGTPVRASADGTVTFAGPVAGALYVTVAHADGVRTSYSYLARIDVVLGQVVRQGQQLGTTTDRFHLGARIGDTYIDPATLFAGASATVALLPLDGAPVAPPAPDILVAVDRAITDALAWLRHGPYRDATGAASPVGSYAGRNPGHTLQLNTTSQPAPTHGRPRAPGRSRQPMGRITPWPSSP